MVLLLENVGQMVEQRNDGRHRRLAQAIIHVFQEILSIFIALIRCQLEPLDRTGSIFWDLLPKQIELAEGILGVLIALFRCGGEPADGGYYILWDTVVSLQQQFSQAVLGKLVPKFRSVCEPFQCGRGSLGRAASPARYSLPRAKAAKLFSFVAASVNRATAF